MFVLYDNDIFVPVVIAPKMNICVLPSTNCYFSIEISLYKLFEFFNEQFIFTPLFAI